jgi:nucleoside-diphosphate kinase
LSTMTLGMIKPDATGAGKAGAIIAHIESKGFRVVAMKMLRLDKAMAREFYAEHDGKPFFGPLVDFITSGPVVAMALQQPDAVKLFREVIGATDPAAADEGTVRKLFAQSKSRNAVHGSDSPASAERELKFFFSRTEMLSGENCKNESE